MWKSKIKNEFLPSSQFFFLFHSSIWGCSENVNAIHGFSVVIYCYSLDPEAVTLFLVSRAFPICIERDWVHSIWEWLSRSSERFLGVPIPPALFSLLGVPIVCTNLPFVFSALLSFVRLSGRVFK